MDYIHGQRIKNKQNALLLGKVMKLAKMIFTEAENGRRINSKNLEVGSFRGSVKAQSFNKMGIINNWHKTTPT